MYDNGFRPFHPCPQQNALFEVSSSGATIILFIISPPRAMRTFILLLTIFITSVSAQRGPRPHELKESPAGVGSSGFVWYPILEDGLAEAKRSNRPILFMAAASQCGGIPGVF